MFSLSRVLARRGLVSPSTNLVGAALQTRLWHTNDQVAYEIIEPCHKVTFPVRTFPEHIVKPDYAHTGLPKKHANSRTIKTKEEIQGIARSCRIAKSILMTTGQLLKPGMTCEDIDDLVYKQCVEQSCYPSPLNYSSFPKCVTTSVNNIALHAVPDQRPLKPGDIISIDVSIYFNGFHGDCCHTFPVGNIDQAGQHLLNVAELCLYEAIKICRAGERIARIGHVIETITKEYDMAVVRDYCGHGVGRDLHEDPQILHYTHDSSLEMQEDMVFTIEPIIIESGNANIVTHHDRWTVSTEDDSRAAQFEHTLWIRKNDAVILTCL